MRSLRSTLAFLPVFGLFAGSLLGQSSAGTISGRVVDSSGGAIAGAQVRVINEVDQQARAFDTSGNGDFTFPQLSPGNYTLSIKMAGFKQLEKTGIHLSASDTLDIGAVRLEIGAVSETIG